MRAGCRTTRQRYTPSWTRRWSVTSVRRRRPSGVSASAARPHRGVLYLHGSAGARALRAASDGGLAACVTVTLTDGLVLARSAFHHSINYRAVVAHGTAVLVTDPAEKTSALVALVEAVAPGRSAATRSPNVRDLAATAVLRLDLGEVSLEVRTGGPNDDPEDHGLTHWAGVLPIGTTAGAPEPAVDLRPETATPADVLDWARP